MLVKTENLKKHFQIGRGQNLHAVDGLSIEIAENEILGLVGESGSGKSTFGKTLIGLHPATSGKAYYKGEELPQRFTAADHLKYSQELQMIFQDPYSSLNPRMTVLDIVGEGISIQGQHTQSQVKELVAEWLIKVGLNADHMSRYPHEFSGGQRQRIGIARALIINPKLIICDEPVSALDVSIQAQILKLLDEIREKMNLSMIFITHDLRVAAQVCDRLAVMRYGEVVETGATQEIFKAPQHSYTRDLLEAVPGQKWDR